jgi:hypothetical protein
MDAFIRKYQSFVLSSLYLVFGLLMLGYSTLYSGKEIAIQDARILTQQLTAEKAVLDKKLKDREAAEKQTTSPQGIQSMPAFLEHINRVAQNTDVIINELTPSKDGELKFVIKMASSYFTFLRFAAGLESLNVSINDLAVRPYDNSKTPPIHAIEFSLTPRGDAEPLTGERLAALQAAVKEQNKRNPFQRFAYNVNTKRVTAEVDLTWIHKLSGIGRLGDKKVATINR